MRNRFLMAGLLAFGVAACGDDVEVVSPTPPVTPPPPPVTATMAPASASVAVGNSVVFAVNASGGVAGEAASWTCSSSNTGIATVSSTSAGCQATGVVAGSVTITAAVSKSGESVNVGSELTVTSDDVVGGDPAFVVISPIGRRRSGWCLVSGESFRGPSGCRGQYRPRRSDARNRGRLLVDGEEVATQSLPKWPMPHDGAEAEGDEPAEQAAAVDVHPIVRFTHADMMRTGVPKFMNGDHTPVGGAHRSRVV